MTVHATIHIACKQLGYSEDERRALYKGVTGKHSLTQMNYGERLKVAQRLNELGFKKASKPRQNALEGAYAKKLQALWIGAWNLGIVKNKSDKALLAFVKRQTGVDHTRLVALSMTC